MEIGVLGPLEVHRDGVRVDIRGAKESTVLAHLVAYAGQVVPATDLIESLWEDDPPPSAAKTLQNYVLRLRNALEPDRDGTPRLILTSGRGYLLAVDRAAVDADRFTSLAELARQALAEGRPQAALDAARDALALWRGQPYAGQEDTDFGRAEARRLGELRQGLLEVRAEALLALDRSAAAVPELERLTQEHPLRERLWELLMLAHYRGGRQAQALETYDRARAHLAEELGVDPGAGLREMQARILAQDPGLDLADRRHGVPEPLRAHGRMVGRGEELQVLRDAWARSLAGAAVTVLVRGPAGAGATRLAAALAEEADRDGAVVLLGGEASAPGSGRWLRVVDGASPEPATSRGMLLLLTGPGSVPPPGVPVVDLSPLGPEQVREIVADYVPPSAVEEVAEEILAGGPAWPGRVHDEAARLARALASRQLVVAVDTAGRSSAALSRARAEVADSIQTLGQQPVRATGDTDDRCPWRGLVAYDVEDAEWFSGREHLVAEVLARLTSTRLLALVGASGSGKSSALRAGVLASVASDVLPGSAGWRRVLMRPGRHPLRELARVALGSPTSDLGELLAHLVRDEDGAPRTLLAVDQLEEVWTACDDPGERVAFLDTLVDLATSGTTSTTVVVALRADFVSAVAQHPALARLLSDGTVLVGSPSPAEIERAVTRPAARAGLVLEDGLAQTIVEAAGDEPGSLPLLSVALTQLWQDRDGGRLSYSGYVRAGGITGAISTLAEQVWRGLASEDRHTARVLLLRLAGRGEGQGVVRRRVPLTEVEALSLPGTRRVLEALADARLVTVSDAHVEVAHESLFREWPRLRDWLSEDTAGHDVLRRLAAAAAEWQAEGRDDSALWGGVRLSAAVDLAAARPDEVTPVERDFLDAGLARVRAREDEARARAAATARQNRRLRWALMATVLLLVAALVAGVLTVRARGEAEASAVRARDSAVSADARRLAAVALNEDRPAVALLEAVEAVRREQSPETYGALLTLLTRQPDVVTRYRIEDRFLEVGTALDGRVVVLSDNIDQVYALDAEDGTLRWQTASPTGGQWGRPVSAPGSDWVAVPLLAGPDAPPDQAVLQVLDAGTGQLRAQVTVADLHEAHPGEEVFVDRSAGLHEGRPVLTTRSSAFVVDPDSGEVLSRTAWEGRSGWHWTLPGGVLVAEMEEGRTSSTLDLDTGRVRSDLPGMVVGVSPDGSQVVTSTNPVTEGGEVSIVHLRDPRSWEPQGGTGTISGFVRSAQLAPDGDSLAVAVDERVELRDPTTFDLITSWPVHNGAVLGTVLAGTDRDLLWTAGRDGTTVALDLSRSRGLLRREKTELQLELGAAAPRAARAVVRVPHDDAPNGARFVNLATGQDLHGELQPYDCFCQVGPALAITPDGRRALATIEEWHDLEDFAPVTDRGRVAVWDVESGEVERTIATPWAPVGLALTADGTRVLVNGSGGWALYEVSSGQELWSHQDPDRPGEPSPVGTLAAAADDDSRMAVLRGTSVVVLSGEDGAASASLDLPGTMALSRALYSADGQTLVVGSLSGRLHFLDAGTLRRVAPDRLVTAGYVVDLQRSPDGSTIAVMGSDGDVTLLDATTWRPYGKPVVDGLGWGFLAFDERQLRIYGELGPDAAIGTDPAAWVEAACRVANTDLTPEESALILPGEPVRPTC
ncbi:BTAD domain-containing putative transcriptional regulator [Ornithinimicrobium tianjinense]